MIYLKVNTKSYRTLDYKKNIVNKIQKTKRPSENGFSDGLLSFHA